MTCSFFKFYRNHATGVRCTKFRLHRHNQTCRCIKHCFTSNLIRQDHIAEQHRYASTVYVIYVNFETYQVRLQCIYYIVSAVIPSWLDYCNSMPPGLPAITLASLKIVSNDAVSCTVSRNLRVLLLLLLPLD